ADRGRLREEGGVRVPALAEDAVNHSTGFLDELLYVRVSRHARGVGIGTEVAKPQGQLFLVLEREILVTKTDHLVVEEGALYLLELFVGHVPQIHTADFRANGAGQGHGTDQGEAVVDVVEPGEGVELHGYIRLLSGTCRRI